MPPTDTAELLAIIDRFAGARIAVVGDLILDRYVWGDVDRISPEAPVVVVSVNRESQSLGGAANVAHNLVGLGAQVSLAGVAADDDHGRLLLRLLEERGIDASGIVMAQDRSTTVKTRVIAAVQQVVRIDRETSDPIEQSAAEELRARVDALLPKTSALIVSDYAKGVITPSFLTYLAEQTARGIFGLGKIPLIIDPKDRNFGNYRGATIVKPNRKEAQAASGMTIKSRADGARAAQALCTRWESDMVLVTLGAEGMVLERKDQPGQGFAVDTHARDVFDVSGAGDTVAAVLSLALAVGAPPPQAATLANFAAGIVVGMVGAVAVPIERLREVVAKGGL